MPKKNEKALVPIKRGPGKPQFKIDWEEVDKLCALHCTAKEIAAYLGCHVNTLVNHCKSEKHMDICDYIEEKQGAGRVSLRRRQYMLAMSGNPTMLVWLGKNWLEQSDKMETKVEASVSSNNYDERLEELLRIK